MVPLAAHAVIPHDDHEVVLAHQRLHPVQHLVHLPQLGLHLRVVRAVAVPRVIHAQELGDQQLMVIPGDLRDGSGRVRLGGRGGGGGDAFEGKGPRRRPQKRLDRRLEEVAKAVGGGYCRLQMPFKPALGTQQTAVVDGVTLRTPAPHNSS